MLVCWQRVNYDLMMTYQVQLFQPLGRVGEIHDSIVGQISAVCQAKLGQPREWIHTPMLETDICDGCTSRQINAFDTIRGMNSNVSHTPIGNVLAIT